ncbi:MAG: 50S ribosomal protein L21 [Candidatus Falkowbacteria bacterium]
MIAIIKTGGKQYKVKEGQTVKVDPPKVSHSGGQESKCAKAGDKVKLETLLIADSESGEIKALGVPSLGDKVSAEVLETAKGKKVTVIKYKNKTRYKRTLGHRQQYSKIKIDKIG